MFDFKLEKEEEKPKQRPETKVAVELKCDNQKKTVTPSVTATYTLMLTNNGSETDTIILRTNLVYSTMAGDEAPEWEVQLSGPDLKELETGHPQAEKECVLKPGETKKLLLEVTSPRGVRYGDKLDTVITAISKTDPAVSDTITLSTSARQAILAVKTAIGHEQRVAEMITAKAKAKKEKAGVFSILSPATLRGYLLVEAMNVDSVRELIRGLRRVHGLVDGETTFNEILHFLTPKPLVSGITEGDIVELVAGPFKGEKARVKQIDETKEEVTIELFEAVVPIPITIRGDHVRVLQKEQK